MEEFEEEMKALKNIIDTEETLWEFEVEKIKNFLINKGEVDNIHSKILSHVINGMEYQVFEEAQKYLMDAKCDLSIYCYDGGMSYKPSNGRPLESVLEDLNQHILLSLSFLSISETKYC
jgi:hypothetical protein